MTRLALTMIVRDEARRLPDFLAHHAPLCDEVVIVDTGSTDGTVTAAEQAGATVVHHRWGDDFAAARNAGLDRVTAPWVLFLDADERISARDFAGLREAIAANGAEQPGCAFLQETWNYCPAGGHLEWRPLPGCYPVEEAGQDGFFIARRVGVFPRRDDLRFSGCVHESVLPAVTAAGLPVRSLLVPVHHFGFVAGPEVNAARRTRYRRLVELKFTADPTDPAAQLEWATVLLEEGAAATAIPVLENLTRGPAGLRPVVRALVLLARLRQEQGQPTAARELLTEAVRQDPDFLFGHLAALRAAAAEDDWPTAEHLLQAAVARFGPDEPLLLREAVRVHSHQRRLPAALAAAEQLVGICPQWTEMRDVAARLRRLIKSI